MSAIQGSQIKFVEAYFLYVETNFMQTNEEVCQFWMFG
jgi:hypothetical protein